MTVIPPGGEVGIDRLLVAVEGGTERTEVAPPLGVAGCSSAAFSSTAAAVASARTSPSAIGRVSRLPYWILFDRSSSMRSEATRVSEIVEC